ncbi:MAG: membrane protein insertase YidC, partial [Deltaproteobacteria bacterium]|nr:membrane protein insertase YidC [Deltaproteobacteria bacterium]
METKRMLIAVVLSMAILLVWQYFYAPEPPKTAPGKPEAPAPAAPASPAPGAPAATSVLPVPAPPAPAQLQAPVTTAALENDLMTIRLSSGGAAVVGASLKGYTDQAGNKGKPIELLSAGSTADYAGEARLAGGTLGPRATFREVQRGPDRVVYAWDSPTGLQVEKTYVIAPGRYDLSLAIRIRNGSTQTFQDRLGLSMLRDYAARQEKHSFVGPSYFKDDKLQEVSEKDIKSAPVSEAGPVAWGALSDKYFLVAAVPPAPAGAVRVGHRPGAEKLVELELEGAPFTLAPGEEKSFAYRLYLGPKLAKALTPVGSHLERVVDYGWFSIIARPLLVFLNAIYSYIGNYGIAIILLTTVVKALFWPLSAKSFRSMQKMKDLQPKLQKLKERYAKDRERLNMEVMQLYKTHKVNPMGGCLPMLLQIPVFFALYRVLLDSIELRHAPFALWIQDLSAPDRLFHFPF